MHARGLVAAALAAVRAGWPASGARRIRGAGRAQFFARRPGTRRRLHPQRNRDRQNPRRDPADPAARHAGLFREFRRPRCRDQTADDRGYDLSPLFDVEAGHLGCRDDAGRGRQAETRRSRFEIHPGLCGDKGRRREARRRRQADAGAGAAQPSDHDRGSAAPYLGPHLRLLWRRISCASSMPRPTSSTAI